MFPAYRLEVLYNGGGVSLALHPEILLAKLSEVERKEAGACDV